MIAALLPLLPFVPMVVLIIVSCCRRAPCPLCGELLRTRAFRRTKRQWAHGGFVCEQCDCEVSISGHLIDPSTPVSMAVIVTWLCVLGLVVAINVLIGLRIYATIADRL